MTARVLVVDDDSLILRTMGRLVRSLGYESELVSNPEEVLARVASGEVDLVITDVVMPQLSGLELLRSLRHAGHRLPVLVMSGSATVDMAVEAVQLGAYDFIEKPAQPARLQVALHNALRFRQLEESHRALEENGGASRIVGNSPPMRRLKDLIARVAPSGGRVLILGENGTGKELVAAAVHRASPRASGPFVKMNCAAVPHSLIESELFGHRRGAFTGAVADRKGKFEQADGGTLFLDEIGDMPAAMQAKLLRVLQEGEFERIGDDRTRSVNVRVLAATHQDLHGMIEAGTFREDLFYRLAVVTLSVPPLRDRLDDLPALVEALAANAADRMGGQPLVFSKDALALLAAHSYPGNVRELQNTVERLAILARSERVEAADVLEHTQAAPSRRGQSGVYRPGVPLRDLMEQAEREILSRSLAEHAGNKSATARALGLERSNFHRKLRRLGVDVPD